MTEVMLALKRSLTTLGRGRVWLYMLIPTLLTLLVMVVLAIFSLDNLVNAFIEQPPMSWIADWGAFWLAKALALIGGWMVVLSASYLLAMVLTAVLVLPLLLKHLSAVDYPDLAQMGKDSFVGATWNSVWAAVLFVIGWVVTLPLWLIPGLGLLLPFFWMGWLNRRTFAYDALAAHASEDEWRVLRREQATALLVLGLLMAVLAHVPFLGLIAPALAALAYVHFCLESLRRLRQGAVISIIEKGRA